jgi:lysophospholipase L1-like esterase
MTENQALALHVECLFVHCVKKNFKISDALLQNGCKGRHFSAKKRIFAAINLKYDLKMKRILTLCLLASLAFPGVCQQAIRHPWQGKRVAYFGDSITDPRNKASNEKYWSYLQQWLGITPYVYGISGRQWNDIPSQTDRLKAEHGDAVDAILIFIGTNDYNAGVPIGQWFTERPEKVEAGIHEPKHLVDRRHRYPVMCDSTYRGRINKALDYVKRQYPTKQIVLITPIHRAQFYANERNWQPREDYTNQCGEYLDAYVESVRQAGSLWSLPVIDLGALCGLYPLMDAYAPYFHQADTDRLHPNDEGHRRMARTLMYQLLTLPCSFQ